MDERILQFRVGVMVAATLLITGILVATFGDLPQLVYGSKTYRVWVESAPGVQSETPIRKSGILIGRVASVRLADDFTEEEAREAAERMGMSLDEFRGGVVITAEIYRDRNIYSNETFTVNATLLGDVVIEVTRTQAGQSVPRDRSSRSGGETSAQMVGLLAANAPAGATEPIEAGTWIRGETATDPTEGLRKLESKLPAVFDSMKRTSDELNDLIAHVNEVISDNRSNIDAAIAETTNTMQSVGRLADNANQVIGDPETQRDLREALDRLPRMLADVHDTVTEVRAGVGKMNTSLNNIEQFTRPLGERGDAMVGSVETSLQRLDALLAELVQFTEAINSRQGSLGRLIHDPALYDNLNQTVSQVKCLTRKLEPIIDDARVFSDKVARHPGVIVRDAVRPGSGLK